MILVLVLVHALRLIYRQSSIWQKPRLPSNFVYSGLCGIYDILLMRLLMGIVDDRAKTKSGADTLSFWNGILDDVVREGGDSGMYCDDEFGGLARISETAVVCRWYGWYYASTTAHVHVPESRTAHDAVVDARALSLKACLICSELSGYTV